SVRRMDAWRSPHPSLVRLRHAHIADCAPRVPLAPTSPRGRVDRAWRGKQRINARLIGSLYPEDWDLPPKPAWMRWHTTGEHIASGHIWALVARFYGKVRRFFAEGPQN